MPVLPPLRQAKEILNRRIFAARHLHFKNDQPQQPADMEISVYALC
jgi:hypothetical protein